MLGIYDLIPELNYRVMWQDIVLLLGFISYFGAGFVTTMVISNVGQYTELANALEGNPIARQILDIRYGVAMMQFMAVSLFTGMYYLLRRHYLKRRRETDYQMLSIYSIAIFMVLFQDFMNDLPILLGLVTGG